MTSPSARFDADLEAAFGAADAEHYAWQTSHPVVGRQEQSLIEAAFLPLGERVLEVGCAEGATLHHLHAPKGTVGVDLFEEKLVFARSALPDCTFVRASAYELPFDPDRFDHVLVRDVVHHLERPSRALLEMRRVLSAGGRLDVLEPCRYNPLVFMHAVTNRAERGELRSTERFLRAELEATGFEVESSQRLCPMPFHRVVFHPRLGSPRLGASRSVSRFVGGIERLARHLVPRAAWAYIHVRARKA